MVYAWWDCDRMWWNLTVFVFFFISLLFCVFWFRPHSKWAAFYLSRLTFWKRGLHSNFQSATLYLYIYIHITLYISVHIPVHEYVCDQYDSPPLSLSLSVCECRGCVWTSERRGETGERFAWVGGKKPRLSGLGAFGGLGFSNSAELGWAWKGVRLEQRGCNVLVLNIFKTF